MVKSKNITAADIKNAMPRDKPWEMRDSDAAGAGGFAYRAAGGRSVQLGVVAHQSGTRPGNKGHQ